MSHRANRRTPRADVLATVVGAGLLGCALSGCMVGPGYERPHVDEPASFKSAPTTRPTTGSPATLPDEWWRLYADAELDRLIATADAANQDLRQAVARVDQARALARRGQLPVADGLGRPFPHAQPYVRQPPERD